MNSIESDMAEVIVCPDNQLVQLEEQVTAIVSHIKSEWRQIGLVLQEIRDLRLYHPQTFEDYLASKPEWGISRRHADRLIKSARVAEVVHQTNWSDWMPLELPNESVARELAKLPEEEQAEAWRKVCEAEGGTPTAKDVANAVAHFDDDDANDQVPANILDDEDRIHDDENHEGSDVSKPASKRKPKNGSLDHSKSSPDVYKIVIECGDLRDGPLLSDTLFEFAPEVAGAANKCSVSARMAQLTG